MSSPSVCRQVRWLQGFFKGVETYLACPSHTLRNLAHLLSPMIVLAKWQKLTYWAQEPANRYVFSPPMILKTISTRQAETPLLLVKMVCKVVSMSFSFSIFASYLSGKRQPSSFSKSELGTFLLPEILPDLRPGIVSSSPRNWDCGRESIIYHVEAFFEM